MTEKKRLLLISNSTLHGSGYLDHAESDIRSFLHHKDAGTRVLFFPYALKNRDGYTAQARARLGAMGCTLESMHEVDGAADARRRMTEALDRADLFFAGGGNTFRLLDCLHRRGLVAALRRRPFSVYRPPMAAFTSRPPVSESPAPGSRRSAMEISLTTPRASGCRASRV